MKIYIEPINYNSINLLLFSSLQLIGSKLVIPALNEYTYTTIE